MNAASQTSGCSLAESSKDPFRRALPLFASPFKRDFCRSRVSSLAAQGAEDLAARERSAAARLAEAERAEGAADSAVSISNVKSLPHCVVSDRVHDLRALVHQTRFLARS